jgi:hypothetical protein
MPPETVPSELNNSEIQTLSEAFYGYLRHVEFLQEEIRKTSQMAAVGMVANTIAHDVRKPFSTLSVGLTAIGQAKTLSDVRQIVTETAESLKKSKSFIEKMLSEIMEAGVTRLNLEEHVRPETLIAGVFDALGPLPEGAQVNITYDLDCGRDFHIDTHRVTRALVNFVNNALEAMNYKGDLWFKLTPTENPQFGKLIVGNSGSFIPAEDIPHLFSPFFTKNKKNGTGLGLAICERIVALHGGTVGCSSDAQRGVEFFMTLPWTVQELPSYALRASEGQPNVKSLARQSSESVGGRKKLTLLIEDDHFLQKRWKKNFPEKFLIFSEPKEFLKSVENHQVNIEDIEIFVADYFFSPHPGSTEAGCCLKDVFEDIRKLYPGTIFIYSDAPQESLNLPKNDPKILFLEKRLYTREELMDLKSQS